MTYLLALSLIVNAVAVILALRAVERAHARADHATQADREHTTSVIHDLCQRIQAPEQAIIDHQARTSPVVNPPAVRFDDDESYWEAATLTKEQLASEVMTAELAHTD